MPATPVISAIEIGMRELSATRIVIAKITIATWNLCGRCSALG